MRLPAAKCIWTHLLVELVLCTSILDLKWNYVGVPLFTHKTFTNGNKKRRSYKTTHKNLLSSNIFSCILLDFVRGHNQASCQWWKGRVHHRDTPFLLALTPTATLKSPVPHACLFRMWQEARVPARIPCRHEENVQTGIGHVHVCLFVSHTFPPSLFKQ